MRAVSYRRGHINRLATAMILAVILVVSSAPGMNGVYAAAKLSVSAESAVVMSGSTGEVVYGIHDERKLPMGGAAKLMTALVVVDRMHDDKEFDNIVQISPKIAELGDRFQAGDRVSVNDLLYTLLMDNSDEAAEALAVYSAGKKSAFVEAMNGKAKELGMVETSYANPTGRYNQKQFSTVREIAILVREVMSNEAVSEILTTSTHEVGVIGATGSFILKWNTGVKASGLKLSKAYTSNDSAAKTYVGFASEDGMDMIVVMVGSYGDSTATEATELFAYGFNNVTKQQIIKADKEVGKIRVRGGEKTHVPVYTRTKGYVFVPEEGSDSLIKTEAVFNKGNKAPLKAGTKVGEYKIYVAGEYQGKVDLVIKENVEKGWFPSYIYISNDASIVIAVFLAASLLLILRVRSVQRARARKRRLERQRKIREMAERQREIEEDRRRRNWTYR